jgi:hypothetical protein
MKRKRAGGLERTLLGKKSICHLRKNLSSFLLNDTLDIQAIDDFYSTGTASSKAPRTCDAGLL